jgi:hypothetical protein
MTRGEAILHAQDCTIRHDAMEDRLLELEVFRQTTGLKAAEAAEQRRLWAQHDWVERLTIEAFAQLHIIDPDACRRLRAGEMP